MKGCKVERSRFIRVDAIWGILETHVFKVGAKMVPKSYIEGSKCLRWSQVDPGERPGASKESQSESN